MTDKPDWDLLHKEYMESDISYTDLAKKYGVSYRHLTQRGRDEGWPKDREKTRKKAVSKASDIIASRQAKSMANLMTAADKLSNRLINDMDLLDGARDVSDIAKALKYAADTLAQVYGIQTPAQLHRQKMDEEKLKLERERLEMDKRRQEADSTAEPVRIMIVQPGEEAGNA